MKISTSELREKALKAYEQSKGTQSEIADLFGISSRTFQRWYRQYKSDCTTSPKPRGHRVAIYTRESLKELDELIQNKPDATLEELRRATGKDCSIMSVHRAVIRLGYSVKKNSSRQRTKER